MGKILTFWSPSNSAGVTTSAILAAIKLSKESSVCMLDLDLNNPDVSMYLGLTDVEHNLDNLLPNIEGKNFTEEIFKMNLVTFDKISVLQGTKKIDKGPSFETGPITEVIEMAKSLFDIVVINTGSPFDNSGTYLSLKNADKVVMVIEQDVKFFKKYVDKSELISLLILSPVVLINRYSKQILLSEESVSEYFNTKPLKLPEIGFESVTNQLNENKDFKSVFMTKKNEQSLDVLTDKLLVELGFKEELDIIKKKNFFFKL